MTSQDVSLAALAIHDLVSRRQTVATAESLTGGLVGAAFTSVPGSSAAYTGGVVSYATRVKVTVLGVPQSIVDDSGVVSRECAEAMASGARSVFDSDWAIATTGVAGPGPEAGVPAGTVWVAVAGPAGVTAVKLAADGGREHVRRAAVEGGLQLLLDTLVTEQGV